MSGYGRGRPITAEQQRDAWAAYQAAPRGVWLMSGAKVGRKAKTAADKAAARDALAELIDAKNAEQETRSAD